LGELNLIEMYLFLCITIWKWKVDLEAALDDRLVDVE
jgi:hypothetical protein